MMKKKTNFTSIFNVHHGADVDYVIIEFHRGPVNYDYYCCYFSGASTTPCVSGGVKEIMFYSCSNVIVRLYEPPSAASNYVL